MAGTLPLFDELEAPGPGGTPAPASGAEGSRAADSLGTTPGARPTGAAKTAPGHLQAARRLSRSIRRFPDRSPQQTRAGIAICRHLRALLAESELDR